MAVSLELAISAIRAGRKQEGRQLLNLLIQQNPNDEKAWLWMSSVVETDEQRARCLYHVLSINPGSQLARKGLQVLGIVLSDSRPVQIPRDSQPIHIPKPTPPAGENGNRSPFLIDPQTVTQELPFTPITPPFQQSVVQASPGILALKVDDDDDAPAPAQSQSPAPEPKPAAKPNPSKPAKPEQESDYVVVYPGIETQGLTAPGGKSEAEAETAPAEAEPTPVIAEKTAPPLSSVETQMMPEPPKPAAPPPQNGTPLTDTSRLPQVYQPGATGAASSTAPRPDSKPFQPTPAPQPSAPPAQSGVGSAPPSETRRSQPVLVNYPDPNAGMPYYYGQPQTDFPPQYPPRPDVHPPGFHSAATMSMPLPGPYQRPPSEPVPVIQTPMGLLPYGGQYPYHSNATILMPTMSEAEARARLANSQAMATASAAAMPLQNMGGWPGMPLPAPAYYTEEEADGDEEGSNEVNVLAVIIFGTLSLTALGGLGMLVLLIFTAPMS